MLILVNGILFYRMMLRIKKSNKNVDKVNCQHGASIRFILPHYTRKKINNAVNRSLREKNSKLKKKISFLKNIT